MFIENLIRGHNSTPIYSFEDFSEFRYSRIKTEKQVHLNKINQRSILNDSNRVLAKNLILTSAAKFIQELQRQATPKQGLFSPEPQEIYELQDLAEIFLEVQDVDQERPDFSIIESNQQLRLLYSVKKKKDSRSVGPQEEPDQPEPFALLDSDGSGVRIRITSSFTLL